MDFIDHPVGANPYSVRLLDPSELGDPLGARVAGQISYGFPKAFEIKPSYAPSEFSQVAICSRRDFNIIHWLT